MPARPPNTPHAILPVFRCCTCLRVCACVCVCVWVCVCVFTRRRFNVCMRTRCIVVLECVRTRSHLYGVHGYNPTSLPSKIYEGACTSPASLLPRLLAHAPVTTDSHQIEAMLRLLQSRGVRLMIISLGTPPHLTLLPTLPLSVAPFIHPALPPSTCACARCARALVPATCVSGR